MTRFAMMPDFSLQKASLEIKVLITCFLLCLFVAWSFAMYNFYYRTHFTLRGTTENFQGNERLSLEELRREGAQMKSRKTDIEILDIIHPHSFMMPFILFVLCHFLLLTSLSRLTKVSVFVVSFLSILVMIFSPLFVRRGGQPFSALMLTSAVALTASFVFLTLYPLYEMWVKPHTKAYGP